MGSLESASFQWTAGAEILVFLDCGDNAWHVVHLGVRYAFCHPRKALRDEKRTSNEAPPVGPSFHSLGDGLRTDIAEALAVR